MYCPNCGSQNDDTYRFCSKCGQSLLSKTLSPAEVQPHIEQGPTRYMTLTSDKSKGVAAVLCALGLLGIAGFHRFYVGKIFTGFLYLVTCGFLWLGTIVDLITIGTGSFNDSSGQPLRK